MRRPTTIRSQLAVVGFVLSLGMVLPTHALDPPVELRKLTVSGSIAKSFVGFSTALNDISAFVGAPAGTTEPGVGYILNSKSGAIVRPVIPSVQRNDSLFGYSAHSNNGLLLVGDPANTNAPVKVAGAAYLFNGANGIEIARLQPRDSRGNDEFGYSVRLHGNQAIIGAPQAGVGVGAAYLFDTRDGKQRFKLTMPEAVAGSDFGTSVAVNDRYALVGAPGNPDVLGFTPGEVYVFNTKTGDYEYTLHAANSFGGDDFGFSMAIQGHYAVIGAPNGGTRNGAAYVYDLTTGRLKFRLETKTNILGTDFGSAVDIYNDRVIVGANGMNTSAGAVYVFDLMTGKLAQTVTASDPVVGSSFGFSVTLENDRLLVGAPRDDTIANNAGAGYVYTLPALSKRGDFDHDGDLDRKDFTALEDEIASNSIESAYDIDGDRLATLTDRVTWLDRIFGTYVGDANFDHEFNSTDIIDVQRTGQYEDDKPHNSTWATGDWDGDRDFTSSDWLAALQGGGYEAGRFKITVPKSQTVPEPASSAITMSLTGMVILGQLRKRRTTSR